MVESENLQELFKEKISFGDSLIKQLSSLEQVDGVSKLQRKINQEVKFLKKVHHEGKAKLQHLQCSNLNQLSALVHSILRECNVVHVDLVVVLYGKKLHVDIISNNGRTWIKVVARNSRSLSDAASGRTSYGSRNVIDQAKDYLEAAKQHPCLFETPEVMFEFASGIENSLAEELISLGVIVLKSDSRMQVGLVNKPIFLLEQDLIMPDNIKTINLDITTMLAYVSSLCNGNCNYLFAEPLLTEQALWERRQPVKVLLNKLFEGKELVCCNIAKTAFEEIVSLIGGSYEKMRAAELLSRVNVLPDMSGCIDLRSSCESLVIEGRIKERSKAIFAFGQAIKAVTVTANEGFVRAAKQQGVELAVFIHEARALTELKETTATLLDMVI